MNERQNALNEHWLLPLALAFTVTAVLILLYLAHQVSELRAGAPHYGFGDPRIITERGDHFASPGAFSRYTLRYGAGFSVLLLIHWAAIRLKRRSTYVFSVLVSLGLLWAFFFA